MSSAKIKSLILVSYQGETEHFKEVPANQVGTSWFRCIFRKKPVRIKTSTERRKLGVRAFHDLCEVPTVLSKISLPIMLHEKEHHLSLVVLRVVSPRKLTDPFIVHCAFDFGYTKEEMDACSVKDHAGRVNEICCKWLMANARNLVEIYRAIQRGHLHGLTAWHKVKVIPVTA